MPTDIAGKILSAVYGFALILLIILTTTAIVDQKMKEQRLYDEMQIFVDRVADARTVTDNDWTDLNIAMAQSHMACTSDFRYYRRAVNPFNTGNTKTTYNREFNYKTPFRSGDLITLQVTSHSYAGAYRLLYSVYGIVSRPFDYTITRRVR